MDIFDVTAFPLTKAREVLENKGYKIEIKISGGKDASDEGSLRVARQIFLYDNVLELVAVQLKERKV